jgi:hypothetical protein
MLSQECVRLSGQPSLLRGRIRFVMARPVSPPTRGERTVTLSHGPSSNVETDCASLFNETFGPFFLFRTPLATLLATYEFQSEKVNGVEVLTYILPNGQSRVVLEVDPTNPSRLQTYTLDGRDGKTGRRRYQTEFRILEWDVFDGLTQPALAERRSWDFEA